MVQTRKKNKIDSSYASRVGRDEWHNFTFNRNQRAAGNGRRSVDRRYQGEHVQVDAADAIRHVHSHKLRDSRQRQRRLRLHLFRHGANRETGKRRPRILEDTACEAADTHVEVHVHCIACEQARRTTACCARRHSETQSVTATTVVVERYS
jgi:hypothetical protein